MKLVVFCILTLLASPLAAQDRSVSVVSVLLENVSGTASNPGEASPHMIFGDGPWKFFFSGSAHATYVSETGPEEQRNETFSTNWLTAGLHHSLGDRGEFLLRGRVSLEPFTMDEGYPQLLQDVPIEAGGPMIDRMRPHDLVGEAAAQLAFRLGGQAHLNLYAAAVGDPALGPVPFAQRSSSSEFAEAPFAYEVQETFHDSTSVVTVGFTTDLLTLEASVFHDAVTFGDHTEFDDGDIDSQSARITLRPTRSLALQISRGELGDIEERTISSASLSWGTSRGAFSAIYTRRYDKGNSTERDSIAMEGTFRWARNTLMARAETVDRPGGFPAAREEKSSESTHHFAVGYIFDVLATDRYRTGLGLNIDYHTQTHELPARYGHKPQGIYAFVRVRTR